MHLSRCFLATLDGLLLSPLASAGGPAFTGLFATADDAETVFANPAGMNLLDTGEAPIDTGESLIKGRVSGKFEDHYTVALEFTYHWQ